MYSIHSTSRDTLIVFYCMSDSPRWRLETKARTGVTDDVIWTIDTNPLARVQVCHSLPSLLTQPPTLPVLAFARTRTQHGYAISHLEARPASAISSARKRLTTELTPASRSTRSSWARSARSVLTRSGFSVLGGCGAGALKLGMLS